jgi:Holliday junction DNA helicase RuvB
VRTVNNYEISFILSFSDLFFVLIHELKLINYKPNILFFLQPGFGINFHLDYYDVETLIKILFRSAELLDLPMTADGAAEIARRSRGTPRIANALLRRIRDFASVKGNGTIDLDIANYGLQALKVDKCGLDEMDNRILTTIINKFKGGPVGLTTLATAVGEEPGTLEEVHEPFLIMEGFIQRTPRGREATQRAYNHLSIPFRVITPGLFDTQEYVYYNLFM